MTKVTNALNVPSSSPKEIVNRKSINVRTDHRLDFERYVDSAINNNLKISAHAIERLNNRNINLSSSDMICINKAIDKVEKKGSKEALILYNNLALIASVQNRTIITAIDKNSLDEKIFTNIDSAIIL